MPEEIKRPWTRHDEYAQFREESQRHFAKMDSLTRSAQTGGEDRSAPGKERIPGLRSA